MRNAVGVGCTVRSSSQPSGTIGSRQTWAESSRTGQSAALALGIPPEVDDGGHPQPLPVLLVLGVELVQRCRAVHPPPPHGVAIARAVPAEITHVEQVAEPDVALHGQRPDDSNAGDSSTGAGGRFGTGTSLVGPDGLVNW